MEDMLAFIRAAAGAGCIGAGFYCLAACVKMKKKKEISRRLLPTGAKLSSCKDKEAYIKAVFPLLSAAFPIFLLYGGMEIADVLGKGVSKALLNIFYPVVVMAFICFAALLARANGRYFDS